MFVFPMVGLSSRFYNAGYSVPKYMLKAKGESLFYHSVNSFKRYFKVESFVFIIKAGEENEEFVNNEVRSLGIANYTIIPLDYMTRGQAETVYRGLKLLTGDLSNEKLTIFNIDTMRPSFTYPKIINKIDGYLEVFRGEGANWSFIRTDGDTKCSVIETAEKKAISDLCSTGLYHFKSIKLFNEAFEKYYYERCDSNDKQSELYVAPIYNSILEKSDIRYHEISPDSVVFYGVPSEYIEFINS